VFLSGQILEADFLRTGFESDGSYAIVLRLDSGEDLAFLPLGPTIEFDSREGSRVRAVWGVRRQFNPRKGVCETLQVIEDISRLRRRAGP
jgi:hypothetical protein